MKNADLEKFVSELLEDFHDKRLSSVSTIKLSNIIKRKNPYLYKAKNILTGEQLIRAILDASISSNEETIFGELLEKLAIYVCKQKYNGQKSSSEGIDLEFEKEGIRYIVAIKSGPNWGNSQQIERLRDNFRKAVKTLRTNNQLINVRAINGCCYGKGSKDAGDYVKLCGQAFWELISGDDDLYIKLIKPFSDCAKEKDELFKEAYASVVNRLTKELLLGFSDEGGNINWDSLIRFNSGK